MLDAIDDEKEKKKRKTEREREREMTRQELALRRYDILFCRGCEKLRYY